ncbi:hypothetical protein ACFYS8_13240 [Kitasatospora sp. NPDC004615]|uniref:hypothetical protein n=1 Tax=unclassified Kitasatospora TaxID=2633591 RepID=UPI0036A26608
MTLALARPAPAALAELHMPVPPLPGGVPYLTYKGLAEYLGINELWLRRHIKRLPHEKYGREVRFSAANVAAIRAMHSHAPLPAESGEAPLIPLATGRTRRA